MTRGSGSSTCDELRRPGLETEWPRIVGPRHIRVHEYFRVKLPMLREVVTKDSPKLVAALDALLDKVGGPPKGELREGDPPPTGPTQGV